MDGCAANTTIPDLVDAKGSVLMTAEEKISALLQLSSNPEQPGLQERSPDGDLRDIKMKTFPKDVMKAELEINKNSGHIKVTALCPVQLEYLDIQNLSEGDKIKLLVVCKESLES